MLKLILKTILQTCIFVNIAFCETPEKVLKDLNDSQKITRPCFKKQIKQTKTTGDKRLLLRIFNLLGKQKNTETGFNKHNLSSVDVLKKEKEIDNLLKLFEQQQVKKKIKLGYIINLVLICSTLSAVACVGYLLNKKIEGLESLIASQELKLQEKLDLGLKAQQDLQEKSQQKILNEIKINQQKTEDLIKRQVLELSEDLSFHKIVILEKIEKLGCRHSLLVEDLESASVGFSRELETIKKQQRTQSAILDAKFVKLSKIAVQQKTGLLKKILVIKQELLERLNLNDTNIAELLTEAKKDKTAAFAQEFSQRSEMAIAESEKHFRELAVELKRLKDSFAQQLHLTREEIGKESEASVTRAKESAQENRKMQKELLEHLEKTKEFLLKKSLNKKDVDQMLQAAHDKIESVLLGSKSSKKDIADLTKKITSLLDVIASAGSTEVAGSQETAQPQQRESFYSAPEPKDEVKEEVQDEDDADVRISEAESESSRESVQTAVEKKKKRPTSASVQRRPQSSSTKPPQERQSHRFQLFRRS